MSDKLPDLEPVEDAKQRVRSALPWLSDPHTCNCGGACKADVQYVAEQAYPTKVWECRECGKRYYREAESGFSASPWR